MCSSVENNSHYRTIIHLDIDCFYDQIELIKNTKLTKIPVGIQQKNIVVTSNNTASEFGVKKCMLVTEALKLCPNLTLVKREDLYDYRQISSKVTAVIQKFAPLIEKLGLNENVADVTKVVRDYLSDQSNHKIKPIGHIFASEEENCECGCVSRLGVGSLIAAEIRKKIKSELGLKCCAGIAHNKLLAKLGCAVNTPDQQTIVYASSSSQLLFNLSDIRLIPGIDQSTFETFNSLGVNTVENLRNCPFEKIQQAFGYQKAKLFMDLSYGKDNSPVKLTGRLQIIGIEDSCHSISLENEIIQKFRALLHRLMILVAEDGRMPRTVKVTIRKFDLHRKTNIKEQKQCNISPTLFTIKNAIQLSLNTEDKLVTIIMSLFHKLVNMNNAFHVTLLGLAFTKFQEQQLGKSSAASFLVKILAVQSVTSLKNTNETNYKSTKMDFSVSEKSSDCNTDGSESEESSPKKSKLGTLIVKRRCIGSSLNCPSPSKLRVAELKLNTREIDQSSSTNLQYICGNVDSEVFKELPTDVQQELIEEWRREKKVSCSIIKKTKPQQHIAYLSN